MLRCRAGAVDAGELVDGAYDFGRIEAVWKLQREGGLRRRRRRLQKLPEILEAAHRDEVDDLLDAERVEAVPPDGVRAALDRRAALPFETEASAARGEVLAGDAGQS